MSNIVGAPQLQGDALGAVNHRGSHLQIIAAAGSGKTEVVSQRIVSLIADGVASREIVGFTFTEKAAEELKQRVSLRPMTFWTPINTSLSSRVKHNS